MPEVIPQLVPSPAPATNISSGEIEMLAARRAFAVAQTLLAGVPIGQSALMNVGWYGSSVHPEMGSFACVRAGAGHDDLVGEIVEVTFGGRAVFAYVVQAVTGIPAPADIALARRAFMALARPTLGVVPAGVVVVDS